MDEIDLILDEIINKREAKVSEFAKRRVITNAVFYQISIEMIDVDKINIYYKWNVGILGKYLFKHIFKQMHFLYSDIKKAFSDSEFSLNEIKFMA